MRGRTVGSIVALVLALIGVVLGVTLTDDDGDGRPEHVTVPLPGAGTVTFDRDNELEPAEQREAAQGTNAGPGGPIAPAAGSPPSSVTPDVHEDLRDERPPDVSKDSANRGLKQKSAPGKGEPVELGGAQGYSCPARYVRNYSSRNGQRTLLFVLHFTVSPPGSLPGIRSQFNTPSSGTSSTFGMELNSKCEQWVPASAKAWTQGNFNGRAESVEIVTYDRTRAQWLASPMIRNGALAALVRDRLRANGLPLRLVDPAGCGVQASGYTDHNRLECGNSHTDVGRNFPFDVFQRQLVLGVPGKRPPSAHAISQCKQLNRYRRTYKSLKQPQRERAAALRRNLDAHKYVCKDRSGRTFIERR